MNQSLLRRMAQLQKYSTDGLIVVVQEGVHTATTYGLIMITGMTFYAHLQSVDDSIIAPLPITVHKALLLA